MLKLDTEAAARDARTQLADARWYLTKALQHVVAADAPKMIARLQSDLKALDGAIRHAQHRANRAAKGHPMRRRGA